MEQIINKERNYGIDLLRIVSMYLVVVLHLLGSADIEAYLPLCSLKYEVAWLLEMLAFCAVNCYALISGYVAINRRRGIANLIVLWFQVWFYSVIIASILSVLYPELVSKEILIKSFFPVITKQYWYFTAYFGLFLVMPLLMYALTNLSKVELKRIIIIGFVLFSILPMLVDEDIFQTANGYSMLWLGYLFLMGGYIRRYGVFETWSLKKILFIWCVSIIFPLGIKFMIEYISWNYLGILIISRSLTKYTSPNVVIQAVVMLISFSRIRISRFWKKIISFISPASFGVYLIHSNELVLEKFLFGKLEIFSQYSTVGMVVSVVFSAFVIFSVCVIIDLVRMKIFELVRVKKFANTISEKWEKTEIFG